MKFAHHAVRWDSPLNHENLKAPFWCTGLPIVTDRGSFPSFPWSVR